MKIREYLISFSPLLFPLLIFSFTKISFSSCMVFVIAYVWHLFLLFPTTSENMSKDGYRFSFVRFIFLIYQKLEEVLNKRKIYALSIFLRFVGPYTFMSICQAFFGEVNFWMLVSGALYFECYYYLRHFKLKSNPPPLP